MARCSGSAARRLVVTAAAVAVMVVAASCGGDSRDERALTVVGTEMAFDAPGRTVAGRYQVTFRNDGAVYHELAFKDPDGQFVARRSIAGGQSITMAVDLGPGTWELGCFEPGHYEAGMHSDLIVDGS